ncbi:hypothetical protein [Micromonospora sp. LOL_024]|uniref:hypothetical protein n=1 Tax=Micromonospora sp. LOL_024 TaxID=3345412 RepID=UPI003A87B03D
MEDDVPPGPTPEEPPAGAFPEAGGQRGTAALRARRQGALPAGTAALAAVVLAGVALASTGSTPPIRRPPI